MNLKKKMKVIKFYSSHCGPCKVMENNLTKANIPHDNYDVELEKNSDLLTVYDIKTIPTTLIFNGDTVVHRIVGVKPVDELKKIYEQYLQIN